MQVNNLIDSNANVAEIFRVNVYIFIVFKIVVGQIHSVESGCVPRKLSRNSSKNYSDFRGRNFDVRILVRIQTRKFDERQQSRFVQHKQLNVGRSEMKKKKILFGLHILKTWLGDLKLWNFHCI